MTKRRAAIAPALVKPCLALKVETAVLPRKGCFIFRKDTMDPKRVTRSSPDRILAFGGIAWSLCLQFFIAEHVAMTYWTGHYSLARNMISDLGARCPLGGATGCPGWPTLMNASFVLQSILIGAGALMLWRRTDGAAIKLGFLLAGLSAPGVMLVGLFPENVMPAIHHDAAASHFILLSFSAICFACGFSRRGAASSPLMLVSLSTALTGAIGTTLLALHIDFGLGNGTIERLVAYPFPIWLAVLGRFYR